MNIRNGKGVISTRHWKNKRILLKKNKLGTHKFAIKLQTYIPVINYIPDLASDSNQINITRKKLQS